MKQHWRTALFLVAVVVLLPMGLLALPLLVWSEWDQNTWTTRSPGWEYQSAWLSPEYVEFKDWKRAKDRREEEGWHAWGVIIVGELDGEAWGYRLIPAPGYSVDETPDAVDAASSWAREYAKPATMIVAEESSGGEYRFRYLAGGVDEYHGDIPRGLE